jgi:hypothetical protein
MTTLDHRTAPAFHIDAATFFTHSRPSRDQRASDGRVQREVVPLASNAEGPPLAGRPDPLAILQSQESDRDPSLIPLRYARMAADPFAFLRGAAAIMASDLSRLPNSGINAQLCGDAHLANFGMFASAERTLVFDLNDFDETLPGPFEWDVKRLAASIAVAARGNGVKPKGAQRAAAAAVESYRSTMARLSDMRTMDVWFSRLDVDVLLERARKTALSGAIVKASEKARRSTGDTALAKLTEVRWPSQIPVPATGAGSCCG